MNIFDADVISRFFYQNYFFFLAAIFLGTFITTWYIIPKIIWVTNEKNLTKPVIDRSLHSNPIPTFGGVAFFVTLILTLSMVQALQLSYVGNHLMAALTILFMVGLKDDLVISSARVKLVGQLLAVFFLIFSPELEITSLHGFLGFEQIPYWLGCVLAAFLLLATINSYNLIDGIDGLAAITGIIIGVIYSVVFYFTGQHFYVLISMTLVGILGAYLRFNFAKGKSKIFMGDSGSLVIGLVIGFLSLKILSLESASLAINTFIPENRLLFVLAVLFVPFFDTTRSMIIRLSEGRNPFSADTSHTHHVLVNSGYSHVKATVLLGFMNSIVVAVFLIFSSIFGSLIMTFIMLGIFGFSCFIFYEIKKRNKLKNNMVNVEKSKGSRIVL
ncbi:MAG TPA: MraY family glycosyltransferase [Salinimicrobium sp.]|nr:MraY family glycosyltransferase [Salinimicrobium sp.]